MRREYSTGVLKPVFIHTSPCEYRGFSSSCIETAVLAELYGRIPRLISGLYARTALKLAGSRAPDGTYANLSTRFTEKVIYLDWIHTQMRAKTSNRTKVDDSSTRPTAAQNTESPTLSDVRLGMSLDAAAWQTRFELFKDRLNDILLGRLGAHAAKVAGEAETLSRALGYAASRQSTDPQPMKGP